MPSGSPVIRLGLMGCGVIANRRHLPAIEAVDGLTLHALFDPEERAAHQAAERFGGRAFSDPEAFLASGLDAVSITSPAPAHKANVLGAARHGLPVLCEKPLAMSGVDAAGMMAAMREADLPFFTAFCYRFSPAALRIRELLRDGAIGDVRSLRLIYIWDAKGRETKDSEGRRVHNRWRDQRMVEGGPLVDCGTHQIDLARFWLDSEVSRFDAAGAWVDEHEAPDHVWLHMDHECGAHTLVETSYSYHFTARQPRAEFVYELIGTRGVIRYDREARSLTLANATGTRALDWAPEKNFVGLYEELLRVLAGAPSRLLGTPEDGLRATEIARAATDDLIRRRLRRSDGPAGRG